MPPTKPLRIWFIHPDLGIGGAERLVVDAAVGLQSLGHQVTIFTSHCDPRHCFEEAKDGTLAVHVRGNTLFPPHFYRRFSILCAILRQLHLVLSLVYLPPTSSPASVNPNILPPPDIFFVDQLSTCIPLLRLLYPSSRILFYCHFPDKLLSPRTNLIKSLYRLPFDFLESYTTSKSHSLIVNSHFTASVFRSAFSGIAAVPRVVYPCVDTSPPQDTHLPLEPPATTAPSLLPLSPPTTHLILSINRFERKKAIELAITSFSHLYPTLRKQHSCRLIIAGGYDPRNAENAQYHSELVALCDKLNLQHATAKNYISAIALPESVDVLFLLSIPAGLKAELLSKARLLVYTPTNEHFGIVPLEAMLSGTPVLATNTGGPLESIVEGVTGWLREPKKEAWTEVMNKVLFEIEDEELQRMGKAGRERVMKEFSKEKMALSLQSEIEDMMEKKVVGSPLIGVGEVGLLIGILVGLVAVVWLWLL
ncbi:hypothetical protein BDZ91DRAFT_709517 [Kalaharituber pfeilii]|nr:hypothetical protein BDZ91DRAFT_709517 [Kalaharituber pfeilii]